MVSNNKINILLDLDQTLISAEKYEEYDIEKYKKKAKKFKSQDMIGYYYVFERPGLQAFLNYLFKNFNVSIWTAASKDYALFIIENIILGKNITRKLDYIFFSYHCTLSEKKYKKTKNLRMLWEVYKLNGYFPYNTIIIDDYKEVFKTQPNNCILVKPFEFTKEGSEKDKFLKELKKELIKVKKKYKNEELKEFKNHIQVVNKNMHKYIKNK